jgi:hypothetical protein
MTFLEVNREAAMAVDRTAPVSLLMALERIIPIMLFRLSWQ